MVIDLQCIPEQLKPCKTRKNWYCSRVEHRSADACSGLYRVFSLFTKPCGSLPDHLIQNLSLTMINQELEYRALKILEHQPDLTQRQLSEALGVSLGKTNYLLKSLIDVGWVKLDNFQKSNNKWGYAYLLTPTGITEKAAITLRFLKRKQQEYNDLQKEIALLQQEIHDQ